MSDIDATTGEPPVEDAVPDGAVSDDAVPDDAVLDEAVPDDAESTDETDALLSRLRLIEDQPLEARAEAFAQVYDELQARLDSGETSRGNG